MPVSVDIMEGSIRYTVQLILITCSSSVLWSPCQPWISEQWTTAPRGKYRVRFLWASCYNISVSWSVENLVLGVFLLKDMVFKYIVDSLTWSSWPTALQLMPWRKLICNTCVFLRDAHHRLLALRHADSAGTILNSEIDNKKHRNAGHMALNRPWRGHLCTVWERRREGRSSPRSASAGNVCGWLGLFFPRWACLWMTTRVLWALIFEVTNFRQ